MPEWSTSDVPTSEAFAFWNDAVCDAFLRVRTEHEQHSSFRGRIRSTSIGTLGLNRVVSQPHLVHRGKASIGQDTDDWFFVNLHAAGNSILSQAGRDHTIRPGDISFHDSIRPFDLRFTDEMALTCFLIPRQALVARTVDAAAAVARPLPRHGAGALLGSFAEALANDAAAGLSAGAADGVGTMFLDLLALTIGATAAGADAARLSTRRACFDQVCAQIRARLCHPDLDLARIAQGCGLAPRTLQTLFKEHGTSVTRYILEQRLTLAERQLGYGTHAAITEIAYAVGFSDLSYFSRAFRRRFGMTASEKAGMARRT